MKKFRVLRNQFLSCYPVHLIDWNALLEDFAWDDHRMVIDNTVESPINKNYPVRIRYQIAFLKCIIQSLESKNEEIHDCVYETFCEKQLRDQQTQEYSFKHYFLPSEDAVISLKEKNSFVSEGTTGLCSWPASLALSEWLIRNKEYFKLKNVLEIGAGIGLCGMIASLVCDSKNVLITDGSRNVVDLLRENTRRNFKNLNDSKEISLLDAWKGFSYNDKRILTGCCLWENLFKAGIEELFLPDVILAADVLYNNSTFEPLSNALEYIFTKSNNICEFILAATIRNEDTFNEFTDILECKNFYIEKEERISPDDLIFWDDSTPIKILRIRRKTDS